MKKTIIKSALLIGAIVVSVYGVLHWKHTVVDPPKQFEFENKHNADLEVSISVISSDSLEDDYQKCLYKLRRYKKEALIDERTMTFRLEDLLNVYIPKFIYKSNTAFASSEWDQPAWSHSFMRRRISELQQMKKSDGADIIESSSAYITQMNSILKIIDKYDDAWELSRMTHYKSNRVTKERVSKADEYKNDANLKNCSALVDALNRLPSKIKSSHLSYLTWKVYDLVCSGIDDYPEFSKDLSELYNRKIQEFDGYYKTSSDTKEIKDKLKDKQYNYLKEYTDYVSDVFHFDTWEEYKTMNERVYGYFGNCIGNDSRISTLKDTYMSNFKKTEEEFNAARFPAATQFGLG